MRTLFLSALALCIATSAQAASKRVVVLGGDVTEIVYALGAGNSIVCDDQTSLYPQAATKLPQVGYLRTLAAEGVLSCKPDLIIASEDAGPPAAVTQLSASDITYARVTNDHSPNAVPTKIETVAVALGVPDKGRALIAQYNRELAAVRSQLALFKDHPRAVFLMAQGPGGMMAAGGKTAANAMLTLAGAANVASFDGYKPLTPEAAIALKPDVIIIADIAVKMMGGMKAARARPEIAMTPAGKTGRIVPMDTLMLLGFGPRTPQALSVLGQALHGGALVH